MKRLNFILFLYVCGMPLEDRLCFVLQIPPLFLKRGIQALQSDKKESYNVKPLLSRGQNLSGTKKTAGKFFFFFFTPLSLSSDFYEQGIV